MTDRKGCAEVGRHTFGDAGGVLVKSIRELERKSEAGYSKRGDKLQCGFEWKERKTFQVEEHIHLFNLNRENQTTKKKKKSCEANTELIISLFGSVPSPHITSTS